jgi:hypothetical protein
MSGTRLSLVPLGKTRVCATHPLLRGSEGTSPFPRKPFTAHGTKGRP